MIKKQKVKYIITAALTLLLVVSPVVALAQTSNCADGSTPVNGKCPVRNPASQYLVGDADYDARDLVVQIITILLEFAAAIAVIFLLVGGFQYIAARGNEEQTEKAKRTISGAIIGIVIIVMSYAIVAIVNNLLLNRTP